MVANRCLNEPYVRTAVDTAISHAQVYGDLKLLREVAEGAERLQGRYLRLAMAIRSALPGAEDLESLVDCLCTFEHYDAVEHITRITSAVTPSSPEVFRAAWEKVEAEFDPFPLDALPADMGEYIRTASESVGCDPCLVGIPLICSFGAAIGNTLRVRLKSDWTEPAAFWGAVIADSGACKTPAARKGLRFTQRAQADRFAKYKNAMREYDADVEAWKDKGKNGRKPDEPILERLDCGDVTIEALAPILLENQRGVLVHRDELAGWFGGMNKYSHGSGDGAQWLETWSSGTLTVDRKTGDVRTIRVPKAIVSICGTIQPLIFQAVLGEENFHNGMVQRFLLCHPPPRQRRWSDTEIPPELIEKLQRAYIRILGIKPLLDEYGNPKPADVPLSAKAKNSFIAFVNRFGEERIGLGGHVGEAMSKKEAYAARFALGVQVWRWALGDDQSPVTEVDVESVEAGIRLARWFAEEDKRIYAEMGKDVSEEDKNVTWIEAHGGVCTVREFQRGRRKYRDDAEAAEAALREFVEADLGEWETVPTGQNGGAPTRRFRLF